MDNILSSVPANNKAHNKILDAALALINNGRFVFPVDRHKKPLIKDWPNLASHDDNQIRQWFAKNNPPNIAVITGYKSGFFCLDVDGDIGRQNLMQLEARYNESILKTCALQTPSHGWHYYFQMPEHIDIKNSVGKIAEHLDIRGNNGYVLVAPSMVINKQGVLRSYQWITNITLANGILPLAPSWLLELIIAVPKEFNGQPISNVARMGTAYGLKALEDECAIIELATKGTRNDTLNRSAFAVFQLVKGNELAEDEAGRALHNAARHCGLPDKEIHATLQSAQKRAFEQPRSAPVTSHSKSESKTPAIKRQPLAILPKPPLEVFPLKIQKLLLEAATAFKRLPVEVPMVALIALLSGCMGRSRSVLVKDGWEEYANLFIVMVANSGLGKSPCFKEFFKPIWAHEVKKKNEWDIAMASYNAEMEERRQTKERAELGPPPVKPIREQYIVEDTTLEALGGILAENQMGLLWCCDELSSIILNFDRYSNAKGGTKARLLSIYDGSPWKTSRRDQDKDKVIESAVLSLVGTVQPKILPELFNQSDALSGLLPRIIFIQANRAMPALLGNEIFTGQEVLQKIVSHLLSWRTQSQQKGQTHLSAEAYAAYEAWHNRVSTKAFYQTEVDKIIAPKLVTQVIRIALLLHCLKAVLADEDGLQPITAETVKEATILGDWIIEHQKLTWQYLAIEDDSKNLLEQAIIMTALELESQLAVSGWRVSNECFNKLVRDKYNEPLDNGLIGRVANQLNIKSIKVGDNRGKSIPPELLNEFKARFII